MLVVWDLGGPRTRRDFAGRSSGGEMGYRWGRDGGEELRDGGLRWIGGIAVSFAGCQQVSAFACGGTGGREGHD